jgi:hypothetical protein
MRASELIGLPVLDAAGHRIGVVTDLRCVKEPGPGGAWGVLTLQALVVDRRRVGSRLGYDRHQRSPALLRGLARRLHGQATVVPWSSVRSWDSTAVHLGTARPG